MFGIGGDSAVRPAGREHFPNYPSYFLYLRIAQLVVSVVVLGLDAYGLSVLSFSGDELMIFTVIAAIIAVVYSLVAILAAPAAYNYWAVLSLDIFLTVFWLISFALLASQVAPFMGNHTYCAYGYCYNYGLSGESLTYAQCLAAASGLGGLNFLLFATTTAVNGLALHDHRNQGLHSVAGQPASAPADADAAEKAAAAAAAGGVAMQPVAGAPAAVQDPYYEQQAAAAQAQAQAQYPAGYTAPPPGTYEAPVDPAQAQYYAQQTMTPPPQQPTPVSYAQPTPPAAADPNAAAYYAAQQQQQQYYAAAAAPGAAPAPVAAAPAPAGP
ncbi:hypothetical protein SCUCBS95973_004580 [Sporothrix curviconia]|uniref:MARVEL domain-containing protein n=1 Tax=Sporothrix curviconia TaxID=1260050 RepID=A0ABP0BPV7_9PEZI